MLQGKSYRWKIFVTPLTIFNCMIFRSLTYISQKSSTNGKLSKILSSDKESEKMHMIITCCFDQFLSYHLSPLDVVEYLPYFFPIYLSLSLFFWKCMCMCIWVYDTCVSSISDQQSKSDYLDLAWQQTVLTGSWTWMQWENSQWPPPQSCLSSSRQLFLCWYSSAMCPDACLSFCDDVLSILST